MPARSQKICVLGPSGVGKTSLVTCAFRKRKFNALQAEPTIGAMFTLYNSSSSGRSYEIWDTAGQERYADLVPMYMRNTSIVLLCIDVQDIYTYEKSTRYIDRLMARHGELLTSVILVFTKMDMCKDPVHANVDTEEFARRIMRQYKNIVHYISTSALSHTGFQELKETIEQVCDRQQVLSSTFYKDDESIVHVLERQGPGSNNNNSSNNKPAAAAWSASCCSYL